MAPEVFEERKYSFPVDIYSLAITVWELFCRKRPYYHLDQITQFPLLTKIVGGERPLFHDSADKTVVTFLKRAWTANPEERATLADFLIFADTTNVHLELPAERSNIADRFEKAVTLVGEIEEPTLDVPILIGGCKRPFLNILDVKSNTWKQLSLHLPYEGRTHGSAFLNGEIYIFGGEYPKSAYKLMEMKWTKLPNMIEERHGIFNSIVVFDGCIWVIGGACSLIPLNTVEAYDPKSNCLIRKPSLKACYQQVYRAIRDKIGDSNTRLLAIRLALDDVPLKIAECLIAARDEPFDEEYFEECCNELTDLGTKCSDQITDLEKEMQETVDLCDEFHDALDAVKSSREKNYEKTSKKQFEDHNKKVVAARPRLDNLLGKKADMLAELAKKQAALNKKEGSQTRILRNIPRSLLDIPFSGLASLFGYEDYETVDQKEKALLVAAKIDKEIHEAIVEKANSEAQQQKDDFQKLENILRAMEEQKNVEDMLIEYLMDSVRAGNMVSQFTNELKKNIGFIKVLMAKIKDDLGGVAKRAKSQKFNPIAYMYVVKTCARCITAVNGTRIYTLIYEQDFHDQLSKETRAFSTPLSLLYKIMMDDIEAAKQETRDKVTAETDNVLERVTDNMDWQPSLPTINIQPFSEYVVNLRLAAELVTTGSSFDLSPGESATRVLYRVSTAALKCSSDTSQALLAEMLNLDDIPDSVVELLQSTAPVIEKGRQLSERAELCDRTLKSMLLAYEELNEVNKNLVDSLQQKRKQHKGKTSTEVEKHKMTKNRLEDTIAKSTKEKTTLLEEISKLGKCQEDKLKNRNETEQNGTNYQSSSPKKTRSQKSQLTEKLEKITETIAKYQTELETTSQKLKILEDADMLLTKRICKLCSLFEHGFKLTEKTVKLWKCVVEEAKKETAKLIPQMSSGNKQSGCNFIHLVLKLQSVAAVYRRLVEKHIVPVIYEARRILSGDTTLPDTSDQSNSTVVALAIQAAHQTHEREIRDKLSSYQDILGL